MEQRKVIKGNRWILLRKDPEKSDKKYKKRLDNILETNKPLATAYYLYEDIDQIWMQKNKEEALRQLEYWCRQAQESKLYYSRRLRLHSWPEELEYQHGMITKYPMQEWKE